MKKTKYTIDDLINLGFVTEVETAEGLKSGEIQLDAPSPTLDAMILGEPFSITTSVSKIADYTFASKIITAIDAPNATSIGNYAFQNCLFTKSNFNISSSLAGYPWGANVYEGEINGMLYNDRSTVLKARPNITTAIDDQFTSIGNNAFSGCIGLSEANFPVCTSIGSGAFAYCYSLSSASFPNCTTISNYAFAYCYSLSSVSFPACTTIGSSAFAYCYSLSTVSFPNCSFIGNNAFYSCLFTKSNFNISSSLAGYPWGATFYEHEVESEDMTWLCNEDYKIVGYKGSTKLVMTIPEEVKGISADIGNVAGQFGSQRIIDALIILNEDEVITLGSNAYIRESYQSGSEKIYVPDHLVENYKVATNWYNFADHIYPLSELPE